MKTTWEVLDDSSGIVQTADEIVRSHHPDIDPEMIRWVLRDPPATSKGREVMGTARAISARERAVYGLGELFVIELSRSDADSLTPRGLRALIDHELCHCQVDIDPETEEPTPRIVAHDVEDFLDVIARHGAWNDDVKRAGQQLQLFEDAGVRPADEILDGMLSEMSKRSITVDISAAAGRHS